MPSIPPDFDRTKFYVGTLCDRGHRYGGDDRSLRRLGNGACLECALERQRQRRSGNYARKPSQNAASDEKHCGSCKQILPKTAFGKNRARNDGLNSICAECAREADYRTTRAARYKVLHHYSNGSLKCACCGESEYEFLAIDHINGGGYQHAKQINYHLTQWLVRHHFPEGFRVLCHNCNSAKGSYGYCPHEQPSDMWLRAEAAANHTSPGRRGVSHGLAKLTEEDVRTIRSRAASGSTRADISREFRLSWSCVDFVVRRQTWKHVE